MKKLSKIVSVILSLALCLGMAAPAFAASFTELQGAIDTGVSVEHENYEAGATGADRYKIEASKDEETGAVNVKLWENVERTEEDEKGISISGSETDVTIDLNGSNIDGNEQAGSVITVTDGGKLTVEDSSGKDESGEYVSAGEGKITGGTSGETLFPNPDGSGKAGGGVYVEDSEFVLNGGNITGNTSNFGGGIGMVDGADVTITNGSVSGNTATNNGGGIYHYGSAYPDGSKASLTVTGGTISNNKAETGEGGAIYSMTMFGKNYMDIKISGTTIENNTAANEGGAIKVNGQSGSKPSLEITNSSIRGNDSAGWGGALSLNCNGLTIKDSIFENNTEKNTNKYTFSEGLYFYSTGKRDISGLILQNSDGSVTIANGNEKVTITAPTTGEKIIVDSEKGTVQIPAGGTLNETAYVHGAIVNRAGTVISVFGHTESISSETPATCTSAGSRTYLCTVCGEERTETIAQLEHTHGEAARENEVPAQIGAEGSYDLVVRCTTCGDVISSEHVTIPALPAPENPDTPENPEIPVIPGGDTDSGSYTPATIEDQEVPLAGLMPVAQLLEELRQYEEIEDAELPEDFQWIDHEYAQAIYWALSEKLVVDTEEQPFDPDEVVTVALLREVLVNYTKLYLGLEDFDVVVEGEDDELVFDLGDRLTAFYGELEAFLKDQAA